MSHFPFQNTRAKTFAKEFYANVLDSTLFGIMEQFLIN